MSDIGTLALVKFEYTDKSGWKVRPGLITTEITDRILLWIQFKACGGVMHLNDAVGKAESFFIRFFPLDLFLFFS